MLAKEFHPDVCFLDINMPKLNGYQAAKAIKSKDWGKDIVLVAATGFGQNETAGEEKKGFFDHHLVKPIRPDHLKRILANVVHH